MNSNSYSKESLPFTYDHSFHAGNIGDVWKHIAFIEAIKSLKRSASAISIIDCYAGAGCYNLNSRGEWKEGIGKLSDLSESELSPAIESYLSLLEQCGFNNDKLDYPGSPMIAKALLSNDDSLTRYEIQPEVSGLLQACLGADKRASVFNSDGLSALDLIEFPKDRKALLLIDPPWTAKSEWTSIPEAFMQFCSKHPDVSGILWYPIKSYTRVAAMIKRFEQEKFRCRALDLITTPLEYQRNRLNGSGVILRNVDDMATAALSHAASQLGSLCSVFKDSWEFRLKSIN